MIALLHAPDQVDPLVEVLGNILALESLAHLVHEVERRIGPRGENRVVEKEAFDCFRRAVDGKVGLAWRVIARF